MADTDWLLGSFGAKRSKALRGYCKFVMVGREWLNSLPGVRYQLLLVDDAFVASHRLTSDDAMPRDVSKAHRRLAALPLSEYRTRHPERDEAMALAYRSGAYTMAQIGQHFSVHYMTVNRAVRKYEAHRKAMMEC